MSGLHSCLVCIAVTWTQSLVWYSAALIHINCCCLLLFSWKYICIHYVVYELILNNLFWCSRFFRNCITKVIIKLHITKYHSGRIWGGGGGDGGDRPPQGCKKRKKEGISYCYCALCEVSSGDRPPKRFKVSVLKIFGPENSLNYPPSNWRNLIDYPPPPQNRAGKLPQ